MSDSYGIRESYRIFPRFTQPFFTWLTGKPLKGDNSYFQFHICFYFFCPILMVISGVFFSLVIISNNYNLLYLFFTWIISISGARLISLTIRHQCVHSNFTRNKKLDMLLADIATSFIYRQSAHAYKIDHIPHHHSRKVLAGINDSHVNMQIRYGFVPGMSKKELWISLIKLIFSPAFQLKHSFARIKNNFYNPPLFRKMFSWITLSFWIVMFISFSSNYIEFIHNITLSFIIPLFILCNISVILELIVEHPYFDYDITTNLTSNKVYATKCWAIFCGEAIPKKHKNIFINIFRWLIWIIKMLFHLVIRLTILPGDIVTHDFHHRHPYSKEWRNYTYARQKDLEKADPNWPPYTEIWGLFNALNASFLHLSKAKITNKS